MKKELKKCEHLWSPILCPNSSEIFGIYDEPDEVYLDESFIIVQCSECRKIGFVIVEKFKRY